MERIWIGVDPGKTGAIASITGDLRKATVEPWPGDATLAADILFGLKARNEIALAALERVHAMPKQGVTSMFNFGVNWGTWIGLLAGLRIPTRLVTPAKWQQGLVQKSDGATPKERSLAVARRLFPTIDLHRKGDHGKADALLLAYWARTGSSHMAARSG